MRRYQPSPLFFLAVILSASVIPPAAAVDFNRDIRPLLAKHCYACHGPDEEALQADLRLDSFAAATADRGGYQAVVPGDAEESELIFRITESDPDIRMPPADAGPGLSEREIELFKEWINQGADYAQHWAFVPPQPPRVPDGSSERANSPIDRFVEARLAAEDLQPSSEADRYALIRRLYLDLTGLPPSPEDAERFVRDTRPNAYSRLVDRLLANPDYAPRWARRWLDLARYADTNGYEKDRPRSIWPYRDWVLRAINRDMPYDEFSIHQLAGDMVPDADAESRIATGFHRNTMLNEEGGIDPLEYRYYAMVDRVATTGKVWLGLSTGCAQCHSHKYDPISHEDYFGLMALLNNADEPDLAIPDREIDAQRKSIDRRIAQLTSELEERLPELGESESAATPAQEELQQHFTEWIAEQHAAARDWHVLPVERASSDVPRLRVLDDRSILSTGDITKRDIYQIRLSTDEFTEPLTALRLEVLPDPRLPAEGPGRAYYEGRRGDFFLSEIDVSVDGEPIALTDPSHDYGKISVGSGSADAAGTIDGDGSTGWSTAGGEGEPHRLVVNFEKPIPAGKTIDVSLLHERHFAASLGRFRFAATTTPEPAVASPFAAEVEAILAKSPADWSDAERERARHAFVMNTPHLAEARKPIERLKESLPERTTTLVLQERPRDNPRTTYLRHRGEYLQPREEIDPGLPSALLADKQREPQDRLEFARWLVSPDNPLAARVAANRAWEGFFGRGLVSTLGDLGTQAPPPTHPELLDWLATELIEHGWSRKWLHREIVFSATYRQSPATDASTQSRDPENRLLSRGPRHRLPAETIRDSALAVSGSLTRRFGGPPVRPPQPASVTRIAYGSPAWDASEGGDRYRRTIYTFLKRTAPFAALTAFDAPSGETCAAQRMRSNNPLQALLLLNDPMYHELACSLGRRVITEAETTHARAVRLLRLALLRPPSAEEVEAVTSFVDGQLQQLRAGHLSAEKICNNDSASDEQAAWTLAARAVINLDEFITKP